MSADTVRISHVPSCAQFIWVSIGSLRDYKITENV